MGFLDSALGFADDLFGSLNKFAPLLQLATAVGGGLLKHSQQQDLFDRQSASINRMEAENRAALLERDFSERARTREGIGNRAREAAIEKARMAAVQAESGASGNTSERLRNSVMAQSGMDIAMLQAHQDEFSRQIMRQLAAEAARANSQRSSLSEPSWMSTGLGILGSGLTYGRQTANPRLHNALQIYDF